jgi:hypothetical protein
MTQPSATPGARKLDERAQLVVEAWELARLERRQERRAELVRLLRETDPRTLGERARRAV